MAWWRLILTGIAIAVLCQFEVKETKWTATKSATLKASADEAFNFVSNPKNAGKWLLYVSRIEEGDNRPLEVGKKLYPVFKIPVYGDYKTECHITEYKKSKRFVLQEPSCIFRPELKFDFEGVTKDESKITITAKYNRFSYFFQYTFAPALYYIENWKMDKMLANLQSQFPQKASTKKTTPKESAKKP